MIDRVYNLLNNISKTTFEYKQSDKQSSGITAVITNLV